MANLTKKCIISGDIFITETILTGLQQNDDITEYYVAEADEKCRKILEQKYRLHTVSDPTEFVDEAQFIILAFKIDNANDTLQKLEHKLNKDTLIVSVISGLAMVFIQNFFPDNEVVRLVLNPSIISGEGIGAYFTGEKTTPEADKTAQSLMINFSNNIIKVNTEAEFEHMRNFILANTFLSYIVVKSMIDAGQKAGFSIQQAGLIADQILKGASRTLIKFQFEGGEMLKEALRHTDVTNKAIDLIKEYGMYDSIERYLTTKEVNNLFIASNDDDNEFDMNYNWFEKFTNQ